MGCPYHVNAIWDNVDVPRTREFEFQLHGVERQLRLCQKISRLGLKAQPLGESLRQIVTLTAEFMQADSCLLYLLSGGELVLCAACGPNPGAVGEVRLRLDEGLTGWVARERRMVAISREAFQDPRFKYFRDLPEDTFEAFLSAPVIVRNRVLGVINVQHRGVHAHSGDEIEMLTMVGEQIGALAAAAALEPAVFDRAEWAGMVIGPRVPVME